ncbi:maleylpyruvate isomerase family mycothiol-dependent enzyme [Kitasatospora sp. NPDC048365]|uniref:maleylpyruvate isomerase family mycothiol-dependent enzyme n=1 Tax=Kitasatospora sp. NPDC048365 TaxID=3364050 RepID=UPI0037140417
MEISEHIDALRRDGALLAEAAAATDLDAPVPTCPDWRLADLLRHTGRVHRWATAYVTDGLRVPLDDAGQQRAWGPDPDDAGLVEWFRTGHSGLVAALEKAPADLDCWSFLPAPSPLAFWARRQAHETAVHRVDAEFAAGLEPSATGPAFAEDGIAELLTRFLVRPKTPLRSERPRTLLVRTTDRPASWLVTVSQEPVVTQELPDGAPAADCVVSGRAHELYLLLWNRLPLERVTAEGDRSLFELWRGSARIRWS